MIKPKVPQFVNYKADKVKRVNPEIEGKENEYEVKLEPNYDYGKKKQPVFSFPKHEDKPPSPEPERLVLNPNYDFEKTKVPVYVNMAKQVYIFYYYFIINRVKINNQILSLMKIINMLNMILTKD